MCPLGSSHLDHPDVTAELVGSNIVRPCLLPSVSNDVCRNLQGKFLQMPTRQDQNTAITVVLLEVVASEDLLGEAEGVAVVRAAGGRRGVEGEGEAMEGEAMEEEVVIRVVHGFEAREP